MQLDEILHKKRMLSTGMNRKIVKYTRAVKENDVHTHTHTRHSLTSRHHKTTILTKMIALTKLGEIILILICILSFEHYSLPVFLNCTATKKKSWIFFFNQTISKNFPQTYFLSLRNIIKA